jgi:hypothetical protein
MDELLFSGHPFVVIARHSPHYSNMVLIQTNAISQERRRFIMPGMLLVLLHYYNQVPISTSGNAMEELHFIPLASDKKTWNEFDS